MHATPHSARDATFDAVKGLLVLLMVAYHAMSIASDAGVEAFRYLRFVSGSFVFVSGFVVARFMTEPYAHDPGRITRRLLSRGAKVLLIFTLLNLAIQASGFGNASKARLGLQGYWEHSARIYLAGDGSASSFLVLLPIAYLLLVAPLVLRIARTRRGRIAAAGALIGAYAASAAAGLEGRWPVMDLLLVGLAGIAAGVPALSSRLLGEALPGRAAVVTGLLLSILLAGYLQDPLAGYVLGVAVVLRCLHALARWLPDVPGPVCGYAVLLGQYSLLAYIAQILILHVLYRAAGGQRLELGAGVAAMGAAAAVLVLALCLGAQRLRRRSGRLDRTYKLIFS